MAENLDEIATGVRPVVTPLTGEDTSAPHGRKIDGTPKKRATPTGRRTAAPPQTDYRTPILGLFQLPAGVLALAGTTRPELAADAAAITIYAPGIAEALEKLAYERPEVAAVLDRVLQVGPYGVLIAATAPLLLQLLANHKVVPAGLLGTAKPEQLLAAFLSDEERAKLFSEDGQGETATNPTA
jgi:hypothetical protein